MDFLLPLLALVAAYQLLKSREQRRRIQLLGSYLQKYRLETLMATLLNGYLRALDEADEERRQGIWGVLHAAEGELSAQLSRLAADFSEVWGEHALVSTLPLAFPYADKLFPRATFDMRDALVLHAQGIAAVVANEGQRSPRDKAFMLSAEILLLQHSCHWFCRSRVVAHARMLRAHQTEHAQALASVSAQTRQAYQKLVAQPGQSTQ